MWPNLKSWEKAQLVELRWSYRTNKNWKIRVNRNQKKKLKNNDIYCIQIILIRSNNNLHLFKNFIDTIMKISWIMVGAFLIKA
jgi:hypothetical protein